MLSLMTALLTVCEASLEDAAAIAEIYAHYVIESTASFETEAPEAETIADRMRRARAGPLSAG